MRVINLEHLEDRDFAATHVGTLVLGGSSAVANRRQQSALKHAVPFHMMEMILKN